MLKLINKYKWLFGFSLFVYICYERNIKSVHEEYERLTYEREIIKREYSQELALSKIYEESIMSEADPKWIELTLIRVLGVVPEGQKKIYFP